MKKIVIIMFCFVLFLSISSKQKFLIPDESIRFRIIANSNEKADQAMKMLIKKDLEKELFSKITTSTSINDTRKIIADNQQNIDNLLKKYNINYNISYGKNYFPAKEYKGVNYNSGEYESLVISLGESKGNNWWCVLYPPLCLLESESNNMEDNEYKLYIQEVLDKVLP